MDGVDDMERTSDFYFLSDLYGMGFTDAMVSELLPEPWKSLNSRNRLESLWRASDVASAMGTERFRALHEQHQRRQSAAQKGVATKRAALTAEAEAAAALLKKPRRFRYETLRKLAVRKQNDVFLAAGERGFAELASIDQMKRWMVNYVRHDLMEYDRLFNSFKTKGRVGRVEAETIFRKRAYELIKKVYPELADECDAQLALRSGVSC